MNPRVVGWCLNRIWDVAVFVRNQHVGEVSVINALPMSQLDGDAALCNNSLSLSQLRTHLQELHFIELIDVCECVCVCVGG